MPARSGRAGGSSAGAGRFQPAISPPAAGRRGMSADSGGGSFSRARRFGGWNSDSPPGLTATPNGGGGTCGTRRGNGGGEPAACGPASPPDRPGSGAPRSGAAVDSRAPRTGDVLTLSENTDPTGSDDSGARGGENHE